MKKCNHKWITLVNWVPQLADNLHWCENCGTVRRRNTWGNLKYYYPSTTLKAKITSTKRGEPNEFSE